MPGPVQSIERAAAILRLLAARSGRLGLVEISASLDLAKGTVHGILRTLQSVGFVEQDPTSGKYQLGAALLHLGSSYLDVNELRARALNWSDALAARTGEAVRVGTSMDSRVLIVHHVFRPDESLQTLEVGNLLPAHACALGKVLLAYGPAPTRAQASQPLEGFTRVTVVDRRALTQELGRVREQGWSQEVEEWQPGEAAVAAPIRAYGGLAVGAIEVRGAVERLCDYHRQPKTEHVTRVREAARAISRELGAARW